MKSTAAIRKSIRAVVKGKCKCYIVSYVGLQDFQVERLAGIGKPTFYKHRGTTPTPTAPVVGSVMATLILGLYISM